MGHEISLLPEALPDDVEDVTWALSTAAALWGRGELKEALVWVRRAAEAAGAAGHDGRAVALARNAVALEGWMATPASPEKRSEEPMSAAVRSVVPSVPPPKPPLPRVAAEKLPKIEPELLEEETNDLRSVPVAAAISSAEAASTAAPSPLVQTVAPQGASTPAAPKSPPPAQPAQLSKLGALADEPVRPAVRRPTLDGPGPLAPIHPAPAPAAGAAGASPSSTLSPPAAALSVAPSSVASVTPTTSRTSEPQASRESLTSIQEQAAREERRAQKKRQRAPILDPWSDELPPSDPAPRTVQQRPELSGADDADVLTSAPSLDVTLKRKPPPPPPKRSGTLTGTVLAPVPESPESRRASALAAAQEEAAVTPPPSAISITAPGTIEGEAPSVSARPPPPRRPTLQPRAASGPQSERKSLPPPPPLPRIVAEDRADGAPPTMPAAQRKITVQPRVQEDAGPPSAAAALARPALAAPVDVTPAPGAAATIAASASPDPALVSKVASNPPPAATARTVAAPEPSAVPDAIPPAAATLPMALPGPAEANSASALDDLTPIAPEVGQLAERERRVSDLPPKPKSDLPPKPKSDLPPRPKSDLPPRPKSDLPPRPKSEHDAAQLARSLTDTLKTGFRTFRLGGIALESVEPFRALSDTGLQLLREKATVTELGAEEEVGATGAVLLLEGSAVICAAVSDAAAHHLLPGTLASCTPTRSDATKIRVVGVAPSKLAAWDRATLEAAVGEASAVRDDLARLGDRHAALAGSTMGPLGDLDESSRLAAFERMSSRTVAPGEVFVPAGGELAGLTVVGSGALMHEDGREFGAGDVVLAEFALESKPLSGALTAGEDGAVVLSATRMGTVELFSIIPTLLELLRPA